MTTPRDLEKCPKPYTSEDLFRMAHSGERLDPLRALATYCHGDNWGKLHAGNPIRNHWTWQGPVIVGWELADQALRDYLETRPAPVVAKEGLSEAALNSLATAPDRVGVEDTKKGGEHGKT